MKLDAYLHVLGRCGPLTIATDEAVAALHEKLSKPGEHVVALRLPDGKVLAGLAVEGSARVVDPLAVAGRPREPMVVFTVDVDEGQLDDADRLLLENAFPSALSAVETTEAERARAMPILEKQAGGAVEPKGAA